VVSGAAVNPHHWKIVDESPEITVMRRAAVLAARQQHAQGLVIGFVVAASIFATWEALLAAVVVGLVVLQWNVRRRP